MTSFAGLKRSADDAAVDGLSVPTSLRLLLSRKQAGAVIGKAGANIKSLREQTSCGAQLSDLTVPPLRDTIRTITQHQVQVIGHYRISKHFDPEQSTQGGGE